MVEFSQLSEGKIRVNTDLGFLLAPVASETNVLVTM